jgi:hypothetical protein
MLYSDGIERDVEPELNRLLREMSVPRLDKLIVDLREDRLLLLAALEWSAHSADLKDIKQATLTAKA